VLARSDGPQGSIGYPAAPPELDYFMSMLKKTAPHTRADQLATIEAKLKTAAAKYLPASNTNAALSVETRRDR
jgi:hypothetical protein